MDVDDFRKESDREGHLGNSQINCDDAQCKEQSQGSFFDGKAESREKVFRHEDDEDKGGNRKDKSRYGEKMGGQGIRSEIIKTHGQRNLLGHRFTGFKRHIESHDSETDEREDAEGENDEKNGKTCLNKGKSLFEIALEIPDEIQDDRRSNQNGANNDAGKSHSIDFCREMRASKIAAIGDVEHEECDEGQVSEIGEDGIFRDAQCGAAEILKNGPGRKDGADQYCNEAQGDAYRPIDAV